jgi:hypothetical protein
LLQQLFSGLIRLIYLISLNILKAIQPKEVVFMKAFKILTILAVAALLMVPATAMAKTKINFSLSLFENLPKAPARPVPVIVTPAPHIVVPCPPPVYHQRTIVYHHYYFPYPAQIEEVHTLPYPSFSYPNR